MPISNEWTEWHLTPRGWERGSMKADGEGVTEIPRPQDAVLTVREHERQGSPYSQMRVWTDAVWRSDDDALVQELRAKFGQRTTD